jgi:YidC/Oxa1 family membrane protein insertase
MESRRMALIALFGVIVYLLYQAWITDYPPAKPAAAIAAGAAAAPGADGQPTLSAAPAANDGSVATPAAAAQRIRVVTDLMVAELSTAGAELRRVELSQYPVEKQKPDVKLALLDDRDGNLLTLQSGVAAVEKPLAGNQTVFATPKTEYAFAEGSDTLDVPFEYTDASGYTLRKVFHFKRGSYEVGLDQTLVNKSGSALSAAPYARWQRGELNASSKKAAPFVNSFFGMGVYEQKPGSGDYRFRKFKPDEIAKTPYESKQSGGWLAMLQHYFVAAIIPPADEALAYTAKPTTAGITQAQYVGATVAVADGAEHSFHTKLYIGPKTQGQLDSIAKGLELTEDYGILTVIAKPLFQVLAFFHGLIGNWGWSIILLTLLVKALFYPLSAAQYRSMAKMKKFTPRIAELKERYADDREKLNKAMMDLYKKEGFNPLAGCWPILVQMPVFFALYWVLNESVELRQAPFMLWLQDLSSKDPLYIMPVLYGASMWIQQRMSGQTATMDPTQAKIMNIMPIAFTGMFLFFPSGLVVYWFVSNVIGIAQQKLIVWQMEHKTAPQPAK